MSCQLIVVKGYKEDVLVCIGVVINYTLYAYSSLHHDLSRIIGNCINFECSGRFLWKPFLNLNCGRKSLVNKISTYIFFILFLVTVEAIRALL